LKYPATKRAARATENQKPLYQDKKESNMASIINGEKLKSCIKSCKLSLLSDHYDAVLLG
jgi:hypothetical protein